MRALAAAAAFGGMGRRGQGRVERIVVPAYLLRQWRRD